MNTRIIKLFRAIFILGLCLLSTITVFSQSNSSKTGFSLKIFTAPEVFFQSNLKAPMPVVGLRGTIIFNTTELEFGFAYSPKFFEIKNANSTNTYQSVFYTYHYILPGIYIHQKIFAKNKHCFSGSVGVSLIVPMKNYCDTLMSDNSHKVKSYPTSSSAYHIVPQIEFSLRYS